MQDCLFCKIIAREMPATIVYEDVHTLVFLDIHPLNLGHSLVIPKMHYQNIHDLPQEMLHHMVDTAQKLASAVKKALNTDGINVNMNNGKAAGQIIPHAHLHIIPRYTNDPHEHHRHTEYKEDEAFAIAGKIKEALA